jgi:transcriptional regulator
MSEVALREFILRVNTGYYEIIDYQLHRKGKPIGSINKDGYLVNALKIGKEYTHRIVFAYYNGIDELLKYETINHKDGNKLNNDISNLEGVTKGDNVRHAFRTGLNHSGEDCTNAVLTEKEVKEIKKLLNLGYNQYNIARHYKVSRSAILNIHLGETWKNVQYDDNTLIPEIENDVKARSDRKLSDEDIEMILNLNSKGVIRREIADKFNVSKALINKIVWSEGYPKSKRGES